MSFITFEEPVQPDPKKVIWRHIQEVHGEKAVSRSQCRQGIFQNDTEIHRLVWETWICFDQTGVNFKKGFRWFRKTFHGKIVGYDLVGGVKTHRQSVEVRLCLTSHRVFTAFPCV
jgi:hypothetical protein